MIDWSPEQVQQERDYMAANFPHAVEIEPPTRKYNCHGYTFANSHGWFCDPDIFLKDDFGEIDMNTARPGDVLIYKDERDEITHSAIVNEALNGQIQTLRSKWGGNAAVTHRLHEVEAGYGCPAQLFRKRTGVQKRSRRGRRSRR